MEEAGLVFKIKLSNMNLQTLTTGWNLIRFIRLGLGIFIGVQAILFRDVLSGMVSSFFLIQAATNTGCCGTTGCNTGIKNNGNQINEEVTFEEVK